MQKGAANTEVSKFSCQDHTDMSFFSLFLSPGHLCSTHYTLVVENAGMSTDTAQTSGMDPTLQQLLETNIQQQTVTQELAQSLRVTIHELL